MTRQFLVVGAARTVWVVACIDVLEHIEPDLLDHVLDDLQRVVAGVGFHGARRRRGKNPAGRRNAHLIQKPASWWLPKFFERFDLMTFDRMPQGSGSWSVARKIKLFSE